MTCDDRFMRTRLLLGGQGIENLKKSTVMIVGLGAVGGYALEAIARSGVGRLILVDFDVFDITNINRQILALNSTIGMKKTEIAAARVHEINPQCQLIVKDMFVNKENLDELLAECPDYVIDAIDTMEPKCNLIEALQKQCIPFISSMGAALKTDASAIRTAKLSQTINCPMARNVRQKLKKRGVSIADIDCVFSSEQCILPQEAIIDMPAGEKNILGSLPTITAIFGLTMANFVILKLAKEKRK